MRGSVNIEHRAVARTAHMMEGRVFWRGEIQNFGVSRCSLVSFDNAKGVVDDFGISRVDVGTPRRDRWTVVLLCWDALCQSLKNVSR